MLLAERFNLDADTLGALELGITKETYLKWKKGYQETYRKVMPIEGAAPTANSPDGIIEAKNAFEGRNVWRRKHKF